MLFQPASSVIPSNIMPLMLFLIDFQMDKVPEIPYFHAISQFSLSTAAKIGRGSFGEVVLALHVSTNRTYAIKIIETTEITSQTALNALQREILIHNKISHPHIIKLWQVLRNESKIYMVMEYAERGNLFYYQNRKTIFTEQEASVYFAQTLSAVQFLHSMNFLHRDLKPENILLDKDNNVKICDFGWVVEGITQTHKTFCGTYEYMAPQMIFDRQYDHRVDIWALGILLYELLHGFAPFEGERLEQVRQSMLAGQIHMHSELSAQVQDLILGILKINPKQRLTCKKIKNHPWIQQMNKKRLRVKQKKGESEEREFKGDKAKIKKECKNDKQEERKQNKDCTNANNSNNSLLFLKDRKRVDVKMKHNNSTQCFFSGMQAEKEKNDDKNILKYLKFLSTKDDKKHKYQSSDHEFIHNQRLKTETNLNSKKKSRNDLVRYGTEIGEQPGTDNRALLKKRKAGGKVTEIAGPGRSNLKLKGVRKSID